MQSQQHYQVLLITNAQHTVDPPLTAFLAKPSIFTTYRLGKKYNFSNGLNNLHYTIFRYLETITVHKVYMKLVNHILLRCYEIFFALCCILQLSVVTSLFLDHPLRTPFTLLLMKLHTGVIFAGV